MTNDGLPDPGWVVERLKEVLQGLAADSFSQISIYPRFVVVADELALDFGYHLPLVFQDPRITLSIEQRRGLEAIDTMLDEMSGHENAHLWTEDALAKNPMWNEIRDLARAALLSFGWDVDPPPPSPNKYVGRE